MDQTEALLSSGNSRDRRGEQDRNDLAVIREQTRETVALLRQLIELLLPKGDPNKPKLEDLIAALVGQQATTIMLCQQISLDLQTVSDRLPAEGGGKPNGHQGPNGLLPS